MNNFSNCKAILFLVVYLFSLHCCFGQDFEVSPVIIKFNANPGEIQEKSLHIKNYGNKVQGFSANLFDFKVENGKRIKQELGSTNRSLDKILSISPSFFELNPNEDIYLSLVLTLPKENSTTHWGYIDVGPAKEQKNYEIDKQLLTTGIKIVPKIEVLVNQSPKSNENFSSVIEDFKEIISNVDSVRVFRTHIKNNGDKILKPNVHLELGVYETAELIKLKGLEKTIYPGESVEFDLKINKNKIISKGQLAIILDYGHNSKIEGSVIEISP